MSIIDEYLGRVGSTEWQLRELLGSVVDAGAPYLVGSLAVGLGFPGSDIDIHVFMDGIENTDAPPMMFFHGNTIVDLEFHPSDAPQKLCSVLSPAYIDLSVGEVALGPAPTLSIQKRLSRWAESVPFDQSFARLLTPYQEQLVARTVVRAALEQTVRYSALGWLLSNTGIDPSPAWRNAAWWVIELLTRERGETFLGAKWIWAKARRANLDYSLLRHADRCGSRQELAILLNIAAIDLRTPEELIIVAPREVEKLSIAGQRFLLTDETRLCPEPAEHLFESTPLPEAVHRFGATTIAGLVAERIFALQVDPEALDAVIA